MSFNLDWVKMDYCPIYAKERGKEERRDQPSKKLLNNVITPLHVGNVQWEWKVLVFHTRGMSFTVRENHYHSLFSSSTTFKNPVHTFLFTSSLSPFSSLLKCLFVPPFCLFSSCPSLTTSCFFCQQLK